MKESSKRPLSTSSSPPAIVPPPAPLPPPPHNNQQLFSDYYLDHLLPQRQDWQTLALTDQAQSTLQEITAIFKGYEPSSNESQTEDGLIKPILSILGHNFEVQASLATSQGTKKPDYIFYRDQAARSANKNKKLTEALLQTGAFAVGDAKQWNLPLDVGQPGAKGDQFRNPSYQIAFYMQQSGLEWGILTNGRLWRLYHKDTAHKLDHFYEVDLPALLASGEMNRFLYFYVFFHRSAFDQHPLSVAAILKESRDYAHGVSESLKQQVYEALLCIARGFFDHTPNDLNPDDPATFKNIYDASLILLYRLLFVLYAEARDLLPLRDSRMYRESYSLYALKDTIAESLRLGKELTEDSILRWAALKQLFYYINVGKPVLKVPTFNGGLFDPERHPFLKQYPVGDAQLQQAIDKLARVNGQFVDYRDLSVRHLGTIYEGLLEYHLEAYDTEEGWDIDLFNEKGERKTSGSYYTPEHIVKYIVDQTIGPVLQAAVEQAADEQANIEAVLFLKVLDPSMGSGHFLVEATEYIARFLVALTAQSTSAVGIAEAKKESELAYWKRRVAQSCIYGVDLNPLAVELAKLSLWLSTVAKDRPLSFLDHHLRTGNALIGARLADLTMARNGNGNGNGTRSKVRKSKEQAAPQTQLALFDDDTFRQSMTTAVDLMWLVKDSLAQTVEQVKEQEQLYTLMREGLTSKYGRLANLVTATYYGLTIDESLWKPVVDFATGRIVAAPQQFIDWLDSATTIANERRFFHWELEFPEIFFDRHGQAKGEQAGFDTVIGNPPWIRQELFSRDKIVLEKLFPHVYHGVADLSTYFVELGNTSLREKGRFGFIIPNKFVRANYGSPLRQFLLSQVRLERLVDFGDLPVFHEATTYPMIVLTSKQSFESSPPPQVKYTLLRHINPASMAADIESGETVLPAAALTNERWVLARSETQTILEKLRSASIPLGEYVAGKVYRGILTGFNEAFVINRRTRDRLVATDPKSAEIIKPFLIGRDVKRYRIEKEDRYIIFTRHGIDLSRYHAIEQYLSAFRAQLEPKPSSWDDRTLGEWPGRKPGPYQWYEIQDTIAYHEEFSKPKIIYPNICKQPEFAYDDKGYYSNQKTFIIPTDDKYLLAVLNSQVMKFLFEMILPKLRGGFFEPGYVFMKDMPIRRISFTTPLEERTTQANAGITLYRTGKDEELLAFVDACLAKQPEQSDIVHDLLAYLAGQMLELKEQREDEVEQWITDLSGLLPATKLQRLGKLWTPLDVPASDDKTGQKVYAEAQENLGWLLDRPLDLREDIGLLSEQQWTWLVRKRLEFVDNFSKVLQVYKQYQPAIAALDGRIALTDRLINEIVYRLYGLSPEEMVIVEGKPS